MASADRLKSRIKVVMFDQYGTVVDMQKGLTEMASPFLARKGWTPHVATYTKAAARINRTSRSMT